MHINPINSLTHAHNTNNIKAHDKHVAFGFGEDYGKDYFVDSNFENDVTPTAWEAIKGALFIVAIPVTLPIAFIRDKMSDQKKNQYYQEILNPTAAAKSTQSESVAKPVVKGGAKGPKKGSGAA